MKLFISSDHAGFEMKSRLIESLQSNDYEVLDLGPDKYNPEDDYPDFVAPVALAVASNADSRGIIIGGSGQGEAICANRFNGVRAVVYYGGNENIIELSRKHNDSNVLSLGARFLNFNEAASAAQRWLQTPFSYEERHIRRIKKLDRVNIDGRFNEKV
jgi:ribose 5-phosphate isomerase B